jgi:hypothetical protein
MIHKWSAIAVTSIVVLSFTCKKNEQPANGEKKFYEWQKFSMGVDLSYVNQVEDYGGCIKIRDRQKMYSRL